jgi:PTH1 family peptidyl-tRNA hydrolase
VDPADYVLGRFPRADDAALDGCVGWAAEATRLACELGAVKAMNQVNRRREPAPQD